MSKVKIGVDVSWMLGQYRGMGRFGRQLTTAVSEQVVALAPQGVSTAEWSCVSRGRSFFPWWEQVELPRLCASENLDYLLCPYNTGPVRSLGSTRTIAVVHDLIFMEPWSTLPPSRSLYQVLGRVYRRTVVPAFVSRADMIITVSHYSKSRLVEAFGLPEGAIDVIPNAIPDDWFRDPVPLSNRARYIFTVAGEQPSKNVHRLLRAFAMTGLGIDEGAELRIAGVKSSRHKDFVRQCRALNIEQHVTFLDFVSEDTLVELYRNARAFVFASTFEGFGIPILEAMASGTPIACSNTTSMPEVVGPHGVLFDPYEVEQIADSLCLVWSDDAERDAQAKLAMLRAQDFSQSAVADQISSFWKRLT